MSGFQRLNLPSFCPRLHLTCPFPTTSAPSQLHWAFGRRTMKMVTKKPCGFSLRNLKLRQGTMIPEMYRKTLHLYARFMKHLLFGKMFGLFGDSKIDGEIYQDFCKTKYCLALISSQVWNITQSWEYSLQIANVFGITAWKTGKRTNDQLENSKSPIQQMVIFRCHVNLLGSRRSRQSLFCKTWVI